MVDRFQQDVEDIRHIPAVETILEVICRTTGMGFAAVARVTEDRWIACDVNDNISFGLKPGGELEIETTICHEIRQHRQPVIINHVANDVQWKTHHTPLKYGFQSYISIPIILSDNTFFGTLCAIDPNPANINTPETIGMFKLFAELIAFHLNATRDLAKHREELRSERIDGELREQFIAVLGHDLRNPLGAISNSAQLLKMMKLGERPSTVADIISNSVLRMSGLIENLMDFARGRLGGGLSLHREPEDLAPILAHVINELQTGWPDRSIETVFDLKQPVDCDSGRIAQVLSNLLGNALTYGDPVKPVRVNAAANGEGFTLSITNNGDPIPADKLGRLFHPFERGDQRDNKGLGLGLYIASEIAAAHGGTLNVRSDAAETCFTLHIPAA